MQLQSTFEFFFFVLLVLSAIAWVVRLALPRLEARRLRLEAARFLNDPREGDRAGYRIGGDIWSVGVVTGVSFDPDERTPVVDLRTEHITGIGVVHHTAQWPVSRLRYFPPDTPVGSVVVPSQSVAEVRR